VITEVVPMLGSIARKATEAAIGEEVSGLVKQMFKRFHTSEADASTALSNDQLGAVHQQVIAACKKVHLPADTVPPLSGQHLSPLAYVSPAAEN
jgi:hypothetical protein